jgi:hypothetical protein
MKRVHYMAGTAGLVPAAIGMVAFPATATAGGTTSHTKTVSLHHARTAPLTTLAASSSPAPSTSKAAPGASPGVAAAGCTGADEFFLPKSGHIRGHGWFTANRLPYPSTCIGTVTVSLYFTKTFCKSTYVSVTDGAAARHNFGPHRMCGQANHWDHTNFGIHRWFVADDTVCAFSTYGGNHKACTYGL